MSMSDGRTGRNAVGRGISVSRFGAAPALRTLLPFLVLIALCLMLGAAANNFLSLNNMVRITSSAAIPAVLTLGATFVILMGAIDLSVEGVMGAAAVALALLVAGDPSVTGSLLGAGAAIATGALLGGFGGLVQVGLRIPSFMVTLAMWFIGLGVATLAVGGGTIAIRDSALRSLALTRFAGFPISVWIAIAAILLAYVIQNHTRLGRRIYAIGGGEDLAELSGVPIRRTKVAVFALAGAFYGLGAVLAAAQLGQGNADIGEGRLFVTITAVVVGGVSLLGGHGSVLTAMIGVLIVAVLSNGMIILGIPPYMQQAVQGLLIIAAVATSLDRSQMKIVK